MVNAPLWEVPPLSDEAVERILSTFAMKTTVERPEIVRRLLATVRWYQARRKADRSRERLTSDQKLRKLKAASNATRVLLKNIDGLPIEILEDIRGAADEIASREGMLGWQPTMVTEAAQGEDSAIPPLNVAIWPL